jgi:hypothetical protein
VTAPGGFHRGRHWQEVLRLADELLPTAVARLDPPWVAQPERRRVPLVDSDPLKDLVVGSAALQLVGAEPTLRELALNSGGLTTTKVTRVLERCTLDQLPMALHCEAIEQGLHGEPEAIYITSRPDVAHGPDKYGAESLVPPRIPLADAIAVPRGARNGEASTCSAYAIGVVDEQPYAIGHVQLVQGWWVPAHWAPHVAAHGLSLASVERQLRTHAGHDDMSVPLLSDARAATTALMDQLVGVRDAHAWKHVRLRENPVGSGWMYTGLAAESPVGVGSRLAFAGADLRSIRAVRDASFVPMLDLPQDEEMLRGRYGSPPLRWGLDWQFRLDGTVRRWEAVAADLTALTSDGEPASRWWRRFEPAALRAVMGRDAMGGVRYHFLRCPVRANANEPPQLLTLVAAVRVEPRSGEAGARWSGWVTTADPLGDGPPERRLEAQVEILRRAEADIRHHRRDGILTEIITRLLVDGWAQRVKRRKYQERMNSSALTIAGRTLLRLASRRI